VEGGKFFPMNKLRQIGLLVCLVLSFVVGCGKKPPVVLSLYCSASHFPVAEELAKTFRQVYGVTVVCIPMDDAAHPAFSTPEDRDSRKRTKKRRKTQRDVIFGSQQVQQLKIWMENAVYKDFSQFLLDHQSGDLYLCDSLVEVQQLDEFELVLKTQPLAYLTPVLMVHQDKGPFYSVEEVLNSHETLGIVRREVGGLGRETDRFLQNLRHKDPNLSFNRLVVFDNETLLLEAWEDNQVAMVICWDSTAARLFPEIGPVALPRTEVLAVPLTMCDLRSGGDYKIMEFFSIFASSEKGQNFFKQFGYKVK